VSKTKKVHSATHALHLTLFYPAFSWEIKISDYKITLNPGIAKKLQKRTKQKIEQHK